MPVQAVCEGTISILPDGSTTCSTGWLVQPTAVPFELSQIDPSVATAFFTGGFVLFITPWATAWGLSQLLKLLR